MIRPLQDADHRQVMQLWLTANMKRNRINIGVGKNVPDINRLTGQFIKGCVSMLNSIAEAADSIVRSKPVEKLAEACIPLLFDPNGKRRAWDESQSLYISEIKNSPRLSPLEKCACIKEFKTIIKKYCNQHDIYEIACRQLSKATPPQEQDTMLDPDWIETFFEAVQFVSNRDLQQIWGRILAKEVLSPGEVPASLLHMLPDMDRYYAQKFQILINHSFSGSIPFIFPDDRFIRDQSLNLSDLLELDKMGVIHYNNNSRFSFQTDENSPGEVELEYCGVQYKAILKASSRNRICLGSVFLSNAGHCLSSILETEPVEGFIEYSKRNFEKNHCQFIKI